MTTPSSLALVRTAQVLNLDLDPDDLRPDRGYLDLVKGDEPPPTGVAQLLMRSRVVPIVYERWWRPALGRLVKGLRGPSMAQEERLARELLALGEGATVVDMACGPGNFTRLLAADVGERGVAIGVDLSATMLARAVRDTDASQVVYVRADVTDLAIRAGSVDAVCCFAALHLFSDPWTALDVMAGALAPGGRMAILTITRPKTLPGALVTTALSRFGGMRVFGADELTGELAHRGLTVIHDRTFGIVQVVGARRPPTANKEPLNQAPDDRNQLPPGLSADP
ncbi:MAG TPA: class I SAM-dependent methyltransferase [Egibacteraceae bacterium]|nr:class I SAM-dependent methyltransferase [Actinomycetota bacterium]HWB71654.1 class I SAM-dependent methyltransferase [Egibacteraceae bacterium]